jgi:hypothetical protein
VGRTAVLPRIERGEIRPGLVEIDLQGIRLDPSASFHVFGERSDGYHLLLTGKGNGPEPKVPATVMAVVLAIGEWEQFIVDMTGARAAKYGTA